jgi:Carbohydrate binding module (family 35)/Bacterial alpha-L-rhamnosidase 6 hairpin glycosidase domain
VILRALAIAGVYVSAAAAQQHDTLYAITDTSVVQGRFTAIAVTRDRIVTNYPRAPREVMFKFSINGQDNEFPPGTDHMIYLRPRAGKITTPVYRFGRVDPPRTPAAEDAPTVSEEGTVQVTFRLDMRAVLASFRTLGAYDPPNGPPIRARDFKGVYVVGNAEPLTWDFSVLEPGSRFELTDQNRDGIYTVTLPFETIYTRPADDSGRAVWVRKRDIARFPDLTSSHRLIDALYRMSLEELVELRRDDGALMGGAKWEGIWTRDVSWGAMLAFAPIAPDEVRRSLMVKVDSSGRIIQDTGTGGSWPVSTDRMAWALAAWELYAVTGDRGWLAQAYDIIRRSAEADLAVAFDGETGLFRGESSFLDWREQSYPSWMEPRDIYESQSLGTNALHHGTYRVLGRMATALGDSTARWDSLAARVRQGMNAHLWLAEQGYYGQFRYGRAFASVSPRAEGLGEALSIIYGVADDEQRKLIARRMPVVPFGVPSFWPYIGDQPPYHNAAIWPQVVGFWTWAAAEAGNGAAVEHGLGSIYRAAALFLTNKENMVASTGHFEGTELNSDRLIGSVAANIATVYRVLFGMRFEHDRLAFRPFVPRAYDGERTLRNFRYRGSTLTITVHGFGSAVASATLDGRPLPKPEIPASLTGAHTIELTMNGALPSSSIAIVENRAAPATPRIALRSGRLVWLAIPGAVSYAVYRNGVRHTVTTAQQTRVGPEDGLAEYQVTAIDARGLESFLSEPIRVVSPDAVIIAQPSGVAIDTTHAGAEGDGYVELTADENTSVEFTVDVPAAGRYEIDARYANGSGPINTGDKAALRSLLVDGNRIGSLVMPHRGADLWTEWGYSSALTASLGAGSHTITLAYTPVDRNMNGAVNTALVDHLRLTRLATR